MVLQELEKEHIEILTDRAEERDLLRREVQEEITTETHTKVILEDQATDQVQEVQGLARNLAQEALTDLVIDQAQDQAAEVLLTDRLCQEAVLQEVALQQDQAAEAADLQELAEVDQEEAEEDRKNK